MKTKVSLILSILIIIGIPAGAFYVLNYGNPYTKIITNNKVPKYLEEKGYKNSDIKEMVYTEPKHLINKDFYHGHYAVIFKNEPKIIYYYGVTKKGKKVYQFCEKTEDNKGFTKEVTEHSEDACVYSLDNR